MSVVEPQMTVPFQSAPRPRGRGDQTQWPVSALTNAVSIRAPPTWAGRLAFEIGIVGRLLVSIRAPPTWAGRPGYGCCCR